MPKHSTRLSRVGVLAPAALKVCIDASVLAAPAAGAVLSTVLKELSKAFMLKKWFHGVMSAQEADNLLMQKGKNGSYLVRESQRHPGEYVLSVRGKGRVSHVKIRRTNNKFDIGGEMFDDLSELIEHCRLYPVAETRGDDLFRLTQPVPEAIPVVPIPPEVEQAKYNYPEPVAPVQPPWPFENDIPAYMGDNLVDREAEEDGYKHLGLGGMVYDDDKAHDDEARALEPGVLDNNTTPGYGFYGKFVGGKGVTTEFQTLNQVERYSRYSSDYAHSPLNGDQNRYTNVLPYDKTRVHIQPYESTSQYFGRAEFTDYINASYIRPLSMFRAFEEMGTDYKPYKRPPRRCVTTCECKIKDEMPHLYDPGPLDSSELMPPGIVKDKFYIATQGCTKNTIYNFWNMILSEDIRIIVMLNRRIENGKNKCERYWPRYHEQLRHKDITIFGDFETHNSVYITREFWIVSPIYRATRVFHYQFLWWPDHGIPSSTKGFRVFLDDINERMLQISKGRYRPGQNVLCIHCSAGIGRTGTAIALDMLIEQYKAEGNKGHVDVHQIVKLLRTQRAGMVQNIKQYMFLYHAMQEHVNEIEAKANRTYRPTSPFD